MRRIGTETYCEDMGGVEELARRSRPFPEDWIPLIPLLWEHIHLVGQYRFEEPVITGELRPLRTEEIA